MSDGPGHIRFVKPIPPKGHEGEEGYFRFITDTTGDRTTIWCRDDGVVFIVEEKQNEVDT